MCDKNVYDLRTKEVSEHETNSNQKIWTKNSIFHYITDREFGVMYKIIFSA